MTLEHDITVHERLASLEVALSAHAERVEGQLSMIIARLDTQNSRLRKSEEEIDLLQAATRRNEEWKESRDDRIGELQTWRLDRDLAAAREKGRQAGRSDLRKADFAKLGLVMAAVQGLALIAAYASGVL